MRVDCAPTAVNAGPSPGLPPPADLDLDLDRGPSPPRRAGGAEASGFPTLCLARETPSGDKAMGVINSTGQRAGGDSHFLHPPDPTPEIPQLLPPSSKPSGLQETISFSGGQLAPSPFPSFRFHQSPGGLQGPRASEMRLCEVADPDGAGGAADPTKAECPGAGPGDGGAVKEGLIGLFGVIWAIWAGLMEQVTS